MSHDPDRYANLKAKLAADADRILHAGDREEMTVFTFVKEHAVRLCAGVIAFTTLAVAYWLAHR